MFEKFRNFWSLFWDSFKQAYNKALKNPPKSDTQDWRDIEKINFLGIFVKKLNTLCNEEATFHVNSDSSIVKPLKVLGESLEAKRYKITSNMLADGDYYVFPATNRKGEIIHTYLTQAQVRILEMDGDEIKAAEGIIDWFVDQNNRVFFLLRRHAVDEKGTLTISYRTVNENGKKAYLEQWAYLDEATYAFMGANHIGFGRYKSPQDSRGLSPVYGVPLNFGCSEIEKKLFYDLQLIDEEFENAKSKLFADETMLTVETDNTTGKKRFNLKERIFSYRRRQGQEAPKIDIYSPAIRQSEHYAKLVSDMGMYEKQVGTSKGILTENETTYTATATAVKRANADTIALMGFIRDAIDAGNQMTLEADSVFLNIRKDLWSYSSDWYDPFEDPSEQWNRLVEAKNNGAAEAEDLVRWQFPGLTDKEVKEKIERIRAAAQSDTNSAIDRIFAGE